jgi:hypothetical protein
MEPTYMVRGADGREYGPATLEQIQGWIREGRLPATHEVKRSDMDSWSPASAFSELQPLYETVTAAAPSPAPISAPPAKTASATVPQIRSSAAWFYWIAALSLVNSISAVSGSTWRFILGLGITQIFDAMGNHSASSGRMISLTMDLITAGILVVLGRFAQQGKTWAFGVGMVAFALDGLIFLLGHDWIGVAFHAFVLYRLYSGFSASRALSA